MNMTAAILFLVPVGVCVGLAIGYRKAIRAARYQAACEAVEAVSEHLAEAGLTNAWVVAQSKQDGSITVLPHTSDSEETTPVQRIKPGRN
jgi:hypothetical protein